MTLTRTIKYYFIQWKNWYKYKPPVKAKKVSFIKAISLFWTYAKWKSK